VLTNKFEIATNNIREKAVSIIEAGLLSINIYKQVNEKVNLIQDTLIVLGQRYNLKDYNRVFLVAFGKGSSDFAASVGNILSWRLSGGISLDIKKPDIPMFETSPDIDFLIGTHPLPSSLNVVATRRIENLVERLDKRDLLIVLITGGGSSLLCSSPDEMQDSILITKNMSRMGAPIEELNIVRKHLSDLKGGGLARLAYPATVLSLIACDVCGEDLVDSHLSLVASGPTMFDKSSLKEVEKILGKYGLVSHNFNLRETPKEPMYFDKVKNILFACNQDALTPMMEKAHELGLASSLVSSTISGEARDILIPLISKVKKGEVLVMGGETVVNVKGNGVGGRNMEAVLGGLQYIKKNMDFEDDWLICSIASDGIDNTESAGALADFEIEKIVRQHNIDLSDFLKRNDSFTFFKGVGGLLYAEKTSFNVADLMFVMRV